MVIRHAKPDDAYAVESVRVRCWQIAYRHVFPPAELDTLAIDERRWRQRFLMPPRGWATFVAERDGEVIGFASVGPSREDEEHGELYAIYVDPDAWSEGAGRALIERAEAQLAETYDEATLWVLSDNPRARRFYELSGWWADGAEKIEQWLGVSSTETRYRKRFKTSRSRS